MSGQGPLPPRELRLAAAAYPVERHGSWSALEAKLDRWVGEAAAEGADIAVLPEYAGLEAALAGAQAGGSPKGGPPVAPAEWCSLAAAQAGRYAALCASLSQRHRLTLVGGSLPVRVGRLLTNRAYLCRPCGEVVPVDKQVLTPWERQETPLSPGPALPVLETGIGRIAALICYDAEFPPLARALAPDILLIPSCTEAASGNARVRAAARARALEAQAIAVHAPLIGAVAECVFVDENTGCAGIYAPPDRPFPADGVLAQGRPDAPGWVVATLPEDALGATRRTGAVAPRAHMVEAERRAARVTSRRDRELDP